MALEQMQEIGGYLQEERRKQQISLDELAKHTCISRRMLEALEDGRFRDVGTPLLIRGFIRSYCKTVGVDPEPIIDRCAEVVTGLNEQNESINRYRAWMTRPPRRRRYLLYSFIACLVLVLGFWGASVWLPARSGKNSQIAKAPDALVYPQKDLPEDLPRQGAQKQPGSAAGTNEPAAPADSDGAAIEQVPSPDAAGADSSANRGPSSSAAQATAEGNLKPVAQGHALVLEAVEETWVRVATDGGKKEKRLLKAGEQHRWEVKEQAQLWLGNAGGVRATWDGKPLKSFGKRGQVVRLRLPNPDYLTP
ncbi:MAG: hypothetical protein AUK55_15815 [Syntrophobacteraceae bacterium CG2_30_61_12]|nr:MAG: hypothetical protein AUK55_15815 [Syntrophobacteraceae bacterium CG2_30_61_12]